MTEALCFFSGVALCAFITQDELKPESRGSLFFAGAIALVASTAMSVVLG